MNDTELQIYSEQMSQTGKRSNDRSSSPILSAKEAFYFDILTQNIEKCANVKFLSEINNILQFFRDGLLKSSEDAVQFSSTILESAEDAVKFSSMIHDVWLDPCFVDAVEETIKEEPVLICDLFMFSNDDSTTQRMACMESDHRFKPSVLLITPDTSLTTTISTFTSILIGHWTDEKVLMELDDKMVEKPFSKHLKREADFRDFEMSFEGKNTEMHTLSFTMDSTSDVETLENLREVLINKYGEEHKDMEATVDRVRKELKFFMEIHGYRGGRIKITIHGYEGNYSVLSLDTRAESK